MELLGVVPGSMHTNINTTCAIIVSNATHSLKEQRQGKVGVIGKGVLGNIHTHIQHHVCSECVQCHSPKLCHTPILCVIHQYFVSYTNTLCHTPILCVIRQYFVSYANTLCHTPILCVIRQYFVESQKQR